MEEYSPEIYDYEDDYDNRYNIFKEYLQELADLNLIFLYRNINLGCEEIFYKDKLISSVLNRDVWKIGEGMNQNSLDEYDQDDREGIVNKYKIWTWFKCNKNMLFNIELSISKSQFL